MAASVVLVMGVCGTGKSCVGQALATELGAVFVEADDFHSPGNREKMCSGAPLTDADRAGWLADIRAHLNTVVAGGACVVVACSALKECYREVLLGGFPRRQVVHLTCPRDVLLQRLGARLESGSHFMPPSLVQSQLDTLEAPSDALTLDTTQYSVADAVERAAREIRC